MIARLNLGGPALNACILTAHLDPRKFRTWLVCGRPQANEREDDDLTRSLNIEPIYVHHVKRRIGTDDIAAFIELKRICSRVQPHIIHTHTAKAGTLGRIIALLQAIRQPFRPRLVHTFHGHVFHGYFSSPVSRAFISIERLLARFTDAIVAVSPEVRRELVEVYRIAPAQKVRIIRLGFDFEWLQRLPQIRGWLRQSLRLDDSTALIGMIGRLTQIKNHALALRAFERLTRHSRTNVHLVIFGDGELRPTLTTLANLLGIQSKVSLVGWEPDRARLFSDLDVTCLSSRNEGTPVALIESLAAGVPVVSTRVGGVPDVVDHALDGELVASDDTDALAVALARLVESRPHVSSQRRAEVQRKYSSQRLVTDVELLYAELLQNIGTCETYG